MGQYQWTDWNESKAETKAEKTILSLSKSNTMIAMFWCVLPLKVSKNKQLKSLVAQFSEELALAQVAVFVAVGFFDKFQNVVVTDVDVQVLVEYALDIVETDQAALLSIE